MAIDIAAFVNFYDNDNDDKNDNDNDTSDNSSDGNMRRGGSGSCARKVSLRSDDKLINYFDAQLRGVVKCPNKDCDCLGIQNNAKACTSVVKYLCWFKKKIN